MRFPFIKRGQEAYVRDHPVALWFSIGILLTGLAQVFIPGASETTATSLAFPDWLETVFSATWIIGGALGAVGMLRGRAKLEASGFALLATGLTLDLIALIYLAYAVTPALPLRVAPVAFLVALAIGFWQRASHLASRSGHPDGISEDEALRRITEAAQIERDTRDS